MSKICDETVYKFVFQDDKDSKVVIGCVVEDSEFLYKVKRRADGLIVDIGKRTLIHKCPIDGGTHG